jgi:diguanylate cyclase (GGDEF)-like protein/PAS domain S-box-containing protein
LEPTPRLPQPAKVIADPDGIGGALGLLHGAADLALMLASVLIAGLLLYLYLRRPDLRLRRLFALFALFILGTGASHLSYWAWSLGGSQWLPGTIDVVAAAIAVLTAGYLLRGMPQVLRMPGEAMLEQANLRLETEVAERRRAQADLQALAEVLERRVQDRTAALETANGELLEQVAERQRTEIALRASQDQLRVALEAARMGVWEWELPSGEVRWSERAAALFGLALRQFDGSLDTVMRMIHPDDRARVTAAVDDCIEGRVEDFFAEYRVVRQDGKVRWLEARGRLYRNDSGEPARMAGLTTDITEQKLSELALAESEERYRSVISGLAEGVMLIAPDGQCLTANESAERILGLTRDELMGRKLRDLAWQTLHADGSPFEPTDYPAVRTLKTGRPCREVLMGVRHGTGELRWITINTQPLRRPAEARPHAVVASFTDVTERVAAESALRESEERFRTLVEHAPEAIVVLDPDTGRFADVNENATRLFGLPRAALLALGPVELSAPVQPDGRDAAQASVSYIEAAVRGETPVFEWLHRDAEGRDIICEVRLVRLRSGERWLVRGSILDIVERKRIEAALRESEAKFAAVFRVCPESISISTVDDGVYIDVNDAYEQVFGYRREHVLGRSSLDLGVWVDALERRELVRRVAQHRIVQDFDASIRRADGEIRTARMSGGALELNGRRCVVLVVRDVTRQKEQEEAVRLAARVFESTAEGILITDPRSCIVAVNQAFTELTGYSEDDVRGHQPSLLASGRHDRRFFDEMWQGINRSGRWHGELWNRTKSGEVRPYLMTISALRDDHEVVLNYVGVMRDISTIKQSQQQLEYMANYDALTGLGNRNLLYARLKVGIEKASRHRRQLAIVFVDLDNFKVINDTLGHDVGDVLLAEIAKRIKSCVRQEDVVCRLGGDEFTVYVEDFVDAQALVGTAQRLTQAVAEPCRISGHDIFVTASVGISIYPNDGQTMSELLKNADTAMYKAKEQGKNGFQFFREDMNARAFERLVFVSGLRRALDRSEFRLVYQPQVQLADRQVLGAECLLRWSHPDMGEVSPGSFIPVAEETGLIVPIGEWVFGEVCRQLREWDGAAVRVSVNVSARQFRQPELVELIRRSLNDARLQPDALAVELTESALIDDPENAAATLGKLKDMGLTISLDDFGTGYSSLSYLKRFPIDSLKIDRAFVRDIVTDPDDAAIVTAIITMAQSLKLDVVAEGVETQQQVDFLRARGCHAAQGYFFSKPLPPEQAGEWLVRRLASDQWSVTVDS